MKTKRIPLRNNIKFYRNAAGMTQGELAAAVDVSRGMIATYEMQNGKHPSIGRLRKIAAVLKVNVEQLVSLDLGEK